MNVEHINPFVISADNIIEQVSQLKSERGKLSLRPRIFPSPEVSVMLGVTGQLKGQVIYGMSEKTALAVAQRMMMGMELPNFDEVARSAICELGNMITGNAASIMEKQNIVTNISPPAIITGKEVSVSSSEGPILVVPLMLEVGTLEINVFLSDNR